MVGSVRNTRIFFPGPPFYISALALFSLCSCALPLFFDVLFLLSLSHNTLTGTTRAREQITSPGHSVGSTRLQVRLKRVARSTVPCWLQRVRVPAVLAACTCGQRSRRGESQVFIRQNNIANVYYHGRATSTYRKAAAVCVDPCQLVDNRVQRMVANVATMHEVECSRTFCTGAEWWCACRK